VTAPLLPKPVNLPAEPPLTRMSNELASLRASVSRIADDVIGLREAIERIDHGQDALLQNGQSLQGQLNALTGQITHMIQVLTPERPEQEGPSLADLLARILTQQSGMAALLRQINDALTRLTPAEAAAAHANTPANGAGRA
jgi:hypothetical protein